MMLGRGVITLIYSLLAFMLCFHYGISSTHYIQWDTASLSTINNKVSVCTGDTVNMTCANCTSSILLAENLNEYNTCTTANCANVADHIGTFQLQGFITVNAVIVSFNFNCNPKFEVGGSVYLIGDVTNDCQTGLKLEVYLMPVAECVSASSTSTSASTSTAGTTTNNNSEGNTGTSTSTSSSSSSTDSSSTDSSSTDSTTSSSVSPTVEGADGQQDQFFVDYSIGVQIGICLGGAVLLLVIVLVLIGVIMCGVKVNRTENVTLGKDESKENMLESIDAGVTKINFSSNSSTSTPTNKVKPMMSVTSPNRPPPPPPSNTQHSNKNIPANRTASTNGYPANKTASTNGNPAKNTNKMTGVSYKKDQDTVFVSPRRIAPSAPPKNSSVSQSVQNYKKNGSAVNSDQLKSV